MGYCRLSKYKGNSFFSHKNRYLIYYRELLRFLAIDEKVDDGELKSVTAVFYIAKNI